MEGERVRQGQKEKGGEGSSLSPINIISMGAQNGLCQQNTGLLSRKEHERDWMRRKKGKGKVLPRPPASLCFTWNTLYITYY